MPKPVPTVQHSQIAIDLVPDPSKPPRLTLLIGYVGKAESADAFRVYLDASFSSFLQFPRSALVRQIPYVGGGLPAPGAFSVWVCADAQVTTGPGSTMANPLGLAQPCTTVPACTPCTSHPPLARPVSETTVSPGCTPCRGCDPCAPCVPVGPPCVPIACVPACFPYTSGRTGGFGGF